jgi:hypothetical protein
VERDHPIAGDQQVDLAQQPLAGGRLVIDPIDDEAHVSLVMLAFGRLREGADILDCQWMEMQQLTKPAELIRLRVVQVEPEELMSLQEPGDSTEIARFEYREGRAAGAHAAQTRVGPGEAAFGAIGPGLVGLWIAHRERRGIVIAHWHRSSALRGIDP